jgi:hypothetical protein
VSPAQRKALPIYGAVIALILFLVAILGSTMVHRIALIFAAIGIFYLSYAFSDPS